MDPGNYEWAFREEVPPVIETGDFTLVIKPRTLLRWCANTETPTMAHPEGTDTASIIQLAQTFPSIASHTAVVEWDAKALYQWASVASHGERLTVQFVLSVWNQWKRWACGCFDVVEAYGVWDAPH